jgi:hypothetical protein
VQKFSKKKKGSLDIAANTAGPKVTLHWSPHVKHQVSNDFAPAWIITTELQRTNLIECSGFGTGCVELKTMIGMLTVSYLVVLHHQNRKAFRSG